jgi:hypothetical protein
VKPEAAFQCTGGDSRGELASSFQATNCLPIYVGQCGATESLLSPTLSQSIHTDTVRTLLVVISAIV